MSTILCEILSLVFFSVNEGEIKHFDIFKNSSTAVKSEGIKNQEIVCER